MESKRSKKVSGHKNSKTDGANGQRLKGAGKFAEIEIRNVETDSSKESDTTKKIDPQKSNVSSKSKKSDLSDGSDEIVISEFKDKSTSSFEENERKNVNKSAQIKNSNNINSTDNTCNKMDDYKFIALTKWVDIKDKPNLKDSVRQNFVNESSETDLEKNSKNKNSNSVGSEGKKLGKQSSSPFYEGNPSSNRTTHKSGDTSEDEDSQPYNNYLKQSCSLPTLTSLKPPNGIEKLKRQLMGKLLETAMCRRKSKWSFRRKCCKQPPPPVPVENLTKGCVIQQILHYNESDEDSCFSDTSEEDGSNASIHYNSPCCDSFNRPCSSNCSSRSSYSNNYNMQSEYGQSPSYCPTYYNPYYCSGYCYPQCGNMCFNPYSFPMEASTNYCTNNCACPRRNKCKCCVQPTINENNCKLKHCSFSSHADVEQCNGFGEPFSAYFPQASEETVCYKCKAVPSNSSGRACCSRSDKIKLVQNSNSYISGKSEVDNNELCDIDNKIE